jgi:DNA-binding LytR/AlgR family response regulator
MKLLHHVSFWTAILFVLTLVFGSRGGNYIESFYFVSMLLPVVVGTAYFFNYYLAPRFLFQKKIFLFVVYSFYMLIVSLYLEMIIITIAFIFLANYQYRNMNPATTNVFVLAVTLYCIVFLYGFILLARRSFVNQRVIQAFEAEKAKQQDDFLLVRVERKTVKILREDIVYLESIGDYVKITTSAADRPLVTKEKISKLHQTLPASFLRIHRSYIVNSAKVLSYNAEQLQIKNVHLPISRTYKKTVLQALQGKTAWQESVDSN